MRLTQKLFGGRRIDAALALVTSMALVCAAVARRARGRRARRGLETAALLQGSVVAIGAWARFVEPHLIDTTRTRASWRGPPLRVALLTDLHVRGGDGPRIERVVRRTVALAPDLVLFGGDYVEGMRASREKLDALGPLARLSAVVPLGAWAVLGNHDETCRRSIQTTLDRLGVGVLENERVTLAGLFALVGVGDFRSGASDPKAAFAGAPPERPTIVLAHSAKSLELPHVGPFDVAFTGHTHGGQGCLPFTEVCPFLEEDMKPYRAGLYDLPRRGVLYVSRGLGMSSVRLRLGARPEIAFVELTPSSPQSFPDTLAR